MTEAWLRDQIAHGMAIETDRQMTITNYQRPDKPRYATTEQRKEGYAFYNQRQWRRASKMHLAREPLCVECEKLGRLTPAHHVDHIEPITRRPELAFEPSNWQSLCRSCHSRKTLRDG
jgi:5-methylcytosine-specific restriction protein A